MTLSLVLILIRFIQFYIFGYLCLDHHFLAFCIVYFAARWNDGYMYRRVGWRKNSNHGCGRNLVFTALLAVCIRIP